MSEEIVNRKVDVNATPEQVFNFLTNPRKIPLVMPGLVENTAIPELPLTEGSKFHYKYQMYGVILDGDWIVERIEGPQHYEARTDGDIKSHFIYKIDGDEDETTLDVTIKYEIPESVLSKVKADVMRKINEREADLLAHNLKTVIELQD